MERREREEEREGVGERREWGSEWRRERVRLID